MGDKIVGLLVGRENTFPGPFLEIVIATGRDDPNVEESRRMATELQDKGVPASLHVWDGWAHDWPYWKEMVDVFL